MGLKGGGFVTYKALEQIDVTKDEAMANPDATLQKLGLSDKSSITPNVAQKIDELTAGMTGTMYNPYSTNTATLTTAIQNMAAKAKKKNDLALFVAYKDRVETSLKSLEETSQRMKTVQSDLQQAALTEIALRQKVSSLTSQQAAAFGKGKKGKAAFASWQKEFETSALNQSYLKALSQFSDLQHSLSSLKTKQSQLESTHNALITEALSF